MFVVDEWSLLIHKLSDVHSFTDLAHAWFVVTTATMTSVSQLVDVFLQFVSLAARQ